MAATGQNEFRDWLEGVDHLGKLQRINGADWNEEIGCITELNVKKPDCPVLIFDNIKNYPAGYRLVTSSSSSPTLVASVLNLQGLYSQTQLIHAVRDKYSQWEENIHKYPPRVVKDSPLLENVQSGKDVDVLKFPVPKWHELDGGRYIGTADAVITKDPDTGQVNLGTYRVMVHDRNIVGLFLTTGQHGSIHISKYHARGQACPVAISVGHHPLVFRAASLEIPVWTPEYNFIGSIFEEPVSVLEEELTGLPIPADAEVVLVGRCIQGKMKDEGPFGEWPGYYVTRSSEPAPIIEVERVYHRNNPILLGSPTGRGPVDSSYFGSVMRSAVLHSELIRSGIPDVMGVWVNEVGRRQFITVSVKQKYAGHAKQAGLMACLGQTASRTGRYVIVVDEDIDPTDLQEVIWAVSTRADPEKDIQIIPGMPSTSLDPLIRRPAKVISNSRAIIDACRPYEWMADFPQPVKTNSDVARRVREKWGNQLGI